MWITKWAYKLGEYYGIDPERIEVARDAWQIDRQEDYETACVAIQDQLTATGILEPPVSPRCNNCREDVDKGWCRCGLHRKPCSDCGGEATSSFQMGTKDWRIGCRGCVRRFKGQSKVAVLEMWNGSVPWHKLHVDHGVGPDRTAYTLGRVDNNGNVEIVGSVLEPLDEAKPMKRVVPKPEPWPCKECGELPEYAIRRHMGHPYRYVCQGDCGRMVTAKTEPEARAGWNERFGRAPLERQANLEKRNNPYNLTPCACGETPRPVAAVYTQHVRWNWHAVCECGKATGGTAHWDDSISNWNNGLRYETGKDLAKHRYDIPTYVTLGESELPKEYCESICPHCKSVRENGICYCFAA
jgi:hypothetical protein